MSCKKCKCKVCSCIKNDVPKIAVNGIVQNQNENDVVNIKVPTKTSQLINDSGFGQGNGGGTGGQKIEDIRVNGELVPIINKEAIMNVPTKTSNLINDSNFVTKIYVDTHIVNRANPHNVTKEQVGLGNVDNTSDLNKPISTATQNALNTKIPTTDVKSEIIYEDLKPVNSKAVEKYAVKKINTIADLRNTFGEYEGQIISLLGYYSAGDKEQLNYKWSSTQIADDGGSVINSGNGSWMAMFGKNIDVKHFGAKGDGVFDNGSIFQTAIDFCIQNNIPLYIPKGTYIIDTSIQGGNSHAIIISNWTSENQGLTMYGDGKGLSIIKEADGATNRGGRWTRMFYCNFGTSSERKIRGSYIFENLTFDKNGRSNEAQGTSFAEQWYYEQSHIICFENSGNSWFPEVRFKNIELIDKIGGGIVFSSLNGQVGTLLFDNITSLNHSSVTEVHGSTDKFGQRACIEPSISSFNCSIINSTILYSQIEPEFTIPKEKQRYYSVVNSRIDWYEYTAKGGYININISNMTTLYEFLVRGISCNVSTSRLRVNGIITSPDLNISNSTILLPYDEQTNNVVPFRFSYIAGLTVNNSLKVSNSVFEIDASENVTAPLGYLIDGGTGELNNYDFNRSFVNCVFDKRAERMANCMYNGTWMFKNCNLPSWGEFSLRVGSWMPLPRYSKVTVDGCDVSGVSTKLFSLENHIDSTYSVDLLNTKISYEKLYVLSWNTGSDYWDKVDFKTVYSDSIPSINTHLPKGLYVKNTGSDLTIKGWVKKVTGNSSTPSNWETDYQFSKSYNVTNIETENAVDLETTLILVNELKSKLNAKLTADRNSGQQAIQ